MKHPPTKPDDLASNMTVREHLATEIFKSMLAAETESIEAAIRRADALIAALNKEVEGEI